MIRKTSVQLNRLIAFGLRHFILFYRNGISPILPPRCRYYPTCSSYALEAIKLHGGYYGTWLTFKRICRCHPWGGSGIDFVPLPFYKYQFFYLPTNALKINGVQRV